ncbi:unnamed protein product [Phytomonas sp. EM1]|nr:unnamed protein product [Phytomonas sp. EM1]|eukprot:CCW60615.1 unnamed protein product [Phytomonas sp. isolate EM1]
MRLHHREEAGLDRGLPPSGGVGFAEKIQQRLKDVLRPDLAKQRRALHANEQLLVVQLREEVLREESEHLPHGILRGWGGDGGRAGIRQGGVATAAPAVEREGIPRGGEFRKGREHIQHIPPRRGAPNLEETKKGGNQGVRLLHHRHGEHFDRVVRCRIPRFGEDVQELIRYLGGQLHRQISGRAVQDRSGQKRGHLLQLLISRT